MQGGRNLDLTSKEMDTVNLQDKPEERNRNAKANKGKDISPTPEPKCYRCYGDRQHKACLFKNAICHYYKKSSHIQRACRKLSRETQKPKPLVNHIDDEESDSDDYLVSYRNKQSGKQR